MKFAKITSLALALPLALLMVVPAAHAGVANQLSKLSFNTPVLIPNHQVLPAGTYWFRIASTLTPNTVLIYNKNNAHVEASLVTVPAYRTKALGRTEVTLAEGAHNHPPILVKWFYPGMKYGHQFIYPSKMENRIHAEIARNVIGQPYSSAG